MPGEPWAPGWGAPLARVLEGLGHRCEGLRGAARSRAAFNGCARLSKCQCFKTTGCAAHQAGSIQRPPGVAPVYVISFPLVPVQVLVHIFPAYQVTHAATVQLPRSHLLPRLRCSEAVARRRLLVAQPLQRLLPTPPIARAGRPAAILPSAATPSVCTSCHRCSLSRCLASWRASCGAAPASPPPPPPAPQSWLAAASVSPRLHAHALRGLPGGPALRRGDRLGGLLPSGAA